MFSTLRTRFGIPGVISVIALVFAMFGGAYAASNSASSGKATASAKAKRGPRGPKGAPGPAGPQGPAGPIGPKGDTGAAGSAGKDGVSVTTSAASSAECPDGGTKITSAGGSTPVCNGAEGEEGEPWTAGGVLPNESTETGAWSTAEAPPNASAFFNIYQPISFSIPLGESLDASQVHYINAAGEEELNGTTSTSTACLGTAARPTATPGNLCVYTGFSEMAFFRIFNPATAQISGAATTGALLAMRTNEHQAAWGTWAVTAG
jgi:hypothetical protein